MGDELGITKGEIRMGDELGITKGEIRKGDEIAIQCFSVPPYYASPLFHAP